MDNYISSRSARRHPTMGKAQEDFYLLPHVASCVYFHERCVYLYAMKCYFTHIQHSTWSIHKDLVVNGIKKLA